MIKYQEFYKNFGIRRADQLMRPPLPMVSRMRLPRQSLVHYLPTSPQEMAPNADYFMFQKNGQPFRIDHVFELTEFEGRPRKLPENPDLKIRDWRRNNPRFKVLGDLESAKRTPDCIVVASYCTIPHNYAYPNSLYRNYHKASNFVRTVIERMHKYCGNNYQQFLEMRLPKRLPSVKLLDRAQLNPSTEIANMFSSVEMNMILMLWRWLGPNRNKFAESKILNAISEETNLVFREGSRFCCLNLAFLNRQRKATRAEVLEWEELSKSDPSLPRPNDKGAEPTAIQKRFLRILMGMLDARNPEAEERLGEGIVTASDAAQTDLDAGITDSPDSDDDDVVQQSVLPVEMNISEAQGFQIEPQDDSAVLELNDDSQQRLELDLDTLAEMESEMAAMHADENSEEVPASTIANTIAAGPEEELTPQERRALERDSQSGMLSPEDTVGNFNRLLARASSDGSLSANDYIALKRSAERINDIEVEGVSLNKYVNIAPEEIKVEESTIPDRDTIIDKSMLKSTLIDYKAKYIKNVMKRDIASMVTNLMNAGYAVQDFQAVDVADIGGKRTEYAIKIKPIEGAVSTIRFTIPVVEPDGSYKINGVSYSTRAQRGDIPVRVVSPTRVALTSYYGKIFVDRCERRTADYGKWLLRHIRAIALMSTNNTITNAVVGNAFESTGEGVRDYTTIAQGFRSFDFMVDGRKYACNFAASTIPERFSKDSIAWAKKNKSTPVGLSADGSMLAADKLGTWYVVEQDGATKPVGTIEQLLELNSSKAPVEFAELKVFGKMIPLGIVLGYMMGIRALLAKLRIKPRIVPAGSRPQLAGDEFKVVFADETWIFDRRDPMSRMIFGGMNEFSEAIMRYNAEEFDRKDVYFNVLESKKLGLRYMREMDTLEQLFVDPITRELLVYYKEPTVFRELLIRAAELLTTDQHPAEVDGDYMREKDYERFAGILYEQLVRAVRTHNSRPGKERFGLEMKNYAVYMAIQQDPAKDQISEINPIQNLKEQEAVTFSGTGGRTSRTMVKRTRVFTKSDEGVISEQTVDSSDVAVNVYRTANPQYINLRGIKRKFDMQRDGITSLLSTSALISPGSTRDD